MTDLLVRLFIGNKDHSDPEVRKRYGFLSGVTGIVFNICLFIGKLTAGILSGAVSVIADALNNLSDAGSSIVNMVGFKIALTPPDREHPFGHGRAEYVSGLVISFIIMLMGVELAKESFEKIISPEIPEISVFTFVVLGAAVLVKLWMFVFNRKLGKKINSVSLTAVAEDSISDAVATSAVVIGMAAGALFNINLDGYIGVLVALFIVYSGVKTAKESLSPLLGQMPDKELVKGIRDMVCAYEGIIGIHDLIIHNYGVGISFISFHAEVSSATALSDAHFLIDKIEKKLKDKFNCGVTIHIDPVDVDDKETMRLKEIALKAVKSIDECLSIHDFRVVNNGSGNAVFFDLAVPYKFRLSDMQIREMTLSCIASSDKAVTAVISVERQLSELD